MSTQNITNKTLGSLQALALGGTNAPKSTGGIFLRKVLQGTHFDFKIDKNGPVVKGSGGNPAVKTSPNLIIIVVGIIAALFFLTRKK